MFTQTAEFFKQEAEKYDKIIAEYQKKGTKYTDPNFHPSKKIQERDPNLLKDTHWSRIDTMLKSPLFDNINPNSICQGTLGDCYLLAALSRLSMCPKLVRCLFDPRSDPKCGAVIVYFFAFGEKVPVLIDTQIPFKRGTRTPIFSHPRNTTESYWFCFVEKAYAKLYGSYTGIVSGNLSRAVYNIFGYMPESYKPEELGDEFFPSLVQWLKEGCIIGTGIHQSDTKLKEELSDLGLITAHAYLVLQAKSAEGKNFVNLRNPWGGHEWLGDYSDCSDMWTEDLKDKLNYVDADDGAFWMLVKDYMKYFTSIDISKPIPDGYTVKSKIVKFVAGEKGAPKFTVELDKPAVINICFEQINVESAIACKFETSRNSVTWGSRSVICAFSSKKYGVQKNYTVTVYSSSSLPDKVDCKLLVRFIGEGKFDVKCGNENIKADDVDHQALKLKSGDLNRKGPSGVRTQTLTKIDSDELARLREVSAKKIKEATMKNDSSDDDNGNDSDNEDSESSDSSTSTYSGSGEVIQPAVVISSKQETSSSKKSSTVIRKRAPPTSSSSSSSSSSDDEDFSPKKIIRKVNGKEVKEDEDPDFASMKDVMAKFKNTDFKKDNGKTVVSVVKTVKVTKTVMKDGKKSVIKKKMSAVE